MGGRVVMVAAKMALVERSPLEPGDLVKHWTLAGNERGLAAAKNHHTRLGLALLLKSYGRSGRFPRGRSELHDDTVRVCRAAAWRERGVCGF
jgi:hypothetical protein